MTLASARVATTGAAHAASPSTGYLAMFPSAGVVMDGPQVATAEQIAVLGSTYRVSLSVGSVGLTISAPEYQHLTSNHAWTRAADVGNPDLAGLEVTGPNGNCIGGRILVNDARDDSAGHISAFDARFEAYCSGYGHVLGEVVLGEPLPPGPLVIPRQVTWPFTEPSVDPVTVPVTVLNTTGGPVSVGSPALQGSAFTLGTNTCVSSLAPGARCAVELKHQPPGAGTFTGSLTLPVSGTTHTVPLDASNITGATYVKLTNPVGDWVIGGSTVTPDFTPTNSAIYLRGGSDPQFDVLASGDRWLIILRPGRGHELSTGTYQVDANNYTPDHPDVIFSGGSAGCAGQRGSYTIDQIERADGVVTRLAGTFDILCNGSDGPTHGEFGFRASSGMVNPTPAPSTNGSPPASPTATPSATATVSPTATPSATATVSPTATPSATAAASPTATAGPSPAQAIALPALTMSSSATLRFTSPSGKADVRYRRAGSGWVYPVSWQGTSATSEHMTLPSGTTMCFGVRSSGAAAWTTDVCTTRPLDDRHFAASSGWSRGTASAYLDTTVSLAVTAGQTLTRPRLVASALSLVATTCNDCGRVAVYWNGRLVKVLSLHSTAARYRQVLPVAIWAGNQTGTITLRTLDRSRVYLDGVVAVRS